MLGAQDLGFFEYLKEYHTGKEKAITSDNLVHRGWGKKREIRQMAHRLRAKAYPVCFSQQGLFVANTSQEIMKTIKHLKSYINSLGEVVEGLEESYYVSLDKEKRGTKR